MSKLLLVALILGAAACSHSPQPTMGGGTPRPGTAPISNSGASAQGMPQSSNSLPAGARVNSPLASPTGAVETTRVR